MPSYFRHRRLTVRLTNNGNPNVAVSRKPNAVVVWRCMTSEETTHNPEVTRAAGGRAGAQPTRPFNISYETAERVGWLAGSSIRFRS